jgi:hypothetical protein
MKKLLVVLSLAMAAFSFQASAATIAWTSTPAGTTAQQVSPFALFGQAGPLAKGHDVSADTWSFSLDALSRIVVEVSSLPVSTPWITGASLNGDAFTSLNGGWIFDSVLAAGEYTIQLFGIAPKNTSGYQLNVETPIPAAVWLFGSALMGLVGASRRKTA